MTKGDTQTNKVKFVISYYV